MHRTSNQILVALDSLIYHQSIPKSQLFFGSGTAESPISHLVRTATATATATAAAAHVQQILNHVIG